MRTRQWRQRGLLAALALSIVWTAVSGKGAGPAAAPAPAPRAALPPAAKAGAPALLRVELERFPRVEPDVGIEEAASHSFAAMSWHVAPPPPPPAPAVKPEPPPPPTAPPMPFTYMGRYEDGAEKVILLVRGDRVYTVSVGEVIEDTYRIERLGERQLELTYLPLGTLQTISTGGT